MNSAACSSRANRPPQDLPKRKRLACERWSTCVPQTNWTGTRKATVEGLGMQFVHVPIASAEALTDEVFAKMRELLKDKTKRPMLVHCFSAGRVGATWLAHRVLDDGLTVEAALAEAKEIGLKKEDFIAKATEYVQRMKATK